MTTDYRALCAELTDALDTGNRFLNSDGEWVVPESIVALVARARAGLAQFQAVLTPERLEALRLARIEAGNGQLDLLEVLA